MATLNSITGTLSSTSSLRGYGGLSSGLDRDSLIESLTYATRTKIENQKSKQTKVEWEQTAIRNIIDKVYNFQNSYTSYASATNVSSSVLFSRSSITTSGEFSKYVSVTGTSQSADMMTIAGVKQLAQNAQLSGATASASTLTTAGIDLDAAFTADKMSGTSIYVQYGDGTYYATLGNIKDTEAYKNSGDVNAALEELINKALAEVDTKDSKTLDEIMKAEVSADGKVTFTDIGSSGNKLEITGGNALEALGIQKGEEALNLAGTSITGTKAAEPTESTFYGDFLEGKTLTFNYNGTAKDIKLADNITDMASLAASLESELSKAFGSGRIKVEASNTGALSFKTIIPDGNETPDTTSTLAITSADKDILGENGAFGVASAVNRIDLTKTLDKAGFANTITGNAELVVNDEVIAIEADDTVQDIMDKINKSSANVTISYQKDADRFIISSNENGASARLKLEGNVADVLFGAGTSTKPEITGQDAIIAVKYAGDDNITEIRRAGNSFTMDGMTVSVDGTFGYSEDGTYIEGTEAVKIEAGVDSDKALDAVKKMITAYNEIVDLINSELKTKPDSDYGMPLTATQKKDMSEDEIKEYNEAAKKGLLFGDNDLRSFAQELRYIIAGADTYALSEIGISESASYSDNGKLVLDETKFKAALESNPEKIDELLNRKAGTDENGNAVSAGMVTTMKNVMDKYCATMGATKGLLVERAGSEHSPLSLLKNTMKTEIDEIAKYIETLLDRLESQEARYISQFSTLETLISQMNSQSSYLSSISSY